MKLRILHVVVQAVLVVDDGDELTPGPTINPVTVPLSDLGALAERIPAELEHLQQEYDAQNTAPVTV